MISKYDVMQTYKNMEAKGIETEYIINEEGTEILDRKTGEYVCSMETYLKVIRQKSHCDFEVIYHEHVSLITIYRCLECGTVIFGGDDEYLYDPNLKCPTCGNYKTRLKYWTKEEIETDESKKQMVKMYEKLTIEYDEMMKRVEARGGLYDWQVFKKNWYWKKHCLKVELENFGHKYSNTPWHKAMVELSIDIGTKEPDGVGYIVDKFYRIPLSPYSFYMTCIFPYTNKCPDDLRKYLPWQKKPEYFKDGI